MSSFHAGGDNPAAPKPVSILSLYRYTTNCDRFRLLVGVICAVLQGAGLPTFSLVYGDVMNALNDPNGGDFSDAIAGLCLKFVYISLGIFVSASLANIIFSYTAKIVIGRVQCAYLQAILARDLGWIDQNKPGSIPSTMQEQVLKMEAALGLKFSMFIFNSSMAILGISIGLWRGWQVTLVMLACLPLMAFTGWWMATTTTNIMTSITSAYGGAGAVAEEVLTAIRTVMAFGQQEKEVARYTSFLDDVRRANLKAGLLLAAALGSMIGSLFVLEGVSFWYGGELIFNQTINPYSGEAYNGGDVAAVLFSVLMGSFALGQIGPCWTAILEGRHAAAGVYQIIDEENKIEKALVSVDIKIGKEVGGAKDASLEVDIGRVQAPKGDQIQLESFRLENVSFWYPSRPDVQVLDSVSLQFKRGEKVAFVGESGSGKSTIVSLLERFYDPQTGRVVVNGMDIRDAFPNPREGLRSKFGYVGQEPVLFAMSIRENLIYGLSGSDTPSTSEIESACRRANIWSFIKSLPDGLETYCGASGCSQISGGQKQRLAIARALLRKPEVLLLDEATSALDNESEKQVQQVLDTLSAEGSITTISIAHRLSTVRGCDRIFVMQKGKLVEEGSHEYLYSKEGLYHTLVKTQEAGRLQEEELKKDVETLKLSRACSGQEKCLADEPGLVKEEEKTSEEEVEKKRREEIAKTYKVPFLRLLQFNKDELWAYVPALLGSALYGCGMPMFAFLLASAMKGLFIVDDMEKMREEVLKSSSYFFGMAAIVFLAAILQHGGFSYLGGWFTLRVRTQLFTKYVHQDADFHDNPDHAPGKLAGTLSTYPFKMGALTGSNLGAMTQALASVICGLALSFAASPPLAAVILAVSPLIAIAGAIEMMVVVGGQNSASEGTKQAQLLFSESVQNLRTVRSACAEQFTLQKYSELLAKPLSLGLRRGIIGGLGYGTSQGLQFLVYALGYWYGSVLIEDGEATFDQVLQAMMGIMMGAAGMGQALAFMGDAAEAKAATYDVFKVLDADIKIDAVAAEKDTAGKISTSVVGGIEFQNVHFRYPHRPEVAILKGLTFSVQKGQRVALVGPSGGGKSTVMALLQRMYDPNVMGDEGVEVGPQAGRLLVGGKDLRDLNVAEWRRTLGVVGQEPVLFDLSLAENVRYGREAASDGDLREAARKANMDFIIDASEKKPESNGVRWEETLGAKGSLLSGGQKQRTAIARALVRRPEVLLFDEATSALDSNSEGLVQAAIDRIYSEGRNGSKDAPTMFIIAHRLSTIKDADVILVISEGALVEQGTHDELVAQGGVYKDLLMQGQK